MQIVDTERAEWKLVLPNPRGGDVYRSNPAAEGGAQVSYDIRFERFGEATGVHVRPARHDFEQLRFAASAGWTSASLARGGGRSATSRQRYYGRRSARAPSPDRQWGDRFITKEQAMRPSRNWPSRRVLTALPLGRRVGQALQQDPLNAIWEQVFGQPTSRSGPGNRQPVVITPAASAGQRAGRARAAASWASSLRTAFPFERQWRRTDLRVRAAEATPSAFLFTRKGSFPMRTSVRPAHGHLAGPGKPAGCRAEGSGSCWSGSGAVEHDHARPQARRPAAS